MKTPKRRKLFIEAVPLVDKQISGIPHALAGIVAAMAANPTIQERFEIVLVVPGSRMHLLDRWRGLENCTRKAIPMKFRIMNGLARRNLLPPMDLLLGPGIYFFGNFFSWALTKRSRSFTMIHDVCFAVHPELVQPENQRMLQKNVPRFIRQTDEIVTVSEHAKSEIQTYFRVPNDKITVVYNGVNRELYKPYPATEVEKVKKKYGLGGRKYFIFIGNIEPRKNLERLTEAMMKLPKDYALIMIGSDGWLNEKVFANIKEANAKGHMIIKPHTYVDDDDVVRLLSGATALVQPSVYEGFGLPALEALVAEVPLVAAGIPPLHEIGGEAAFYFDPYNVDAMATAMKKATTLTAKERQERISKGLVRAKQFTWEKAAERLAKKFVAADQALRP